MQSWRNYRDALRGVFGVLVVLLGYLTFERRTGGLLYVNGSYFLDVRGGTNGGHEHGLVALWEVPIVGVSHSSNKYNDN